MKFAEYLRGKTAFIVLCLFVSAFTGFLLYTVQSNLYMALFTPGIFFGGGLLCLLPEYIEKRRFYNNLQDIVRQLEKRHFLAEIIECPDFFEGKMLYDVLKITGESMNNELAKYKLASEEYREYIELWVHEIKTPIAGAKLICENSKQKTILNEVDKIEYFVEQALFFSRSKSVEKDYIIKQVTLESLVDEALKNNARYLISNNVSIVKGKLSYLVSTDMKWMIFILRQLIDNSVKYGSKRLVWGGSKNTGGIVLMMEDDGVGIPAKDIGRVFDKGFTGENGRQFSHSTGLGLYLCKILCEKLGLEISIHSPGGKGTMVQLLFPNSNIWEE